MENQVSSFVGCDSVCPPSDLVSEHEMQARFAYERSCPVAGA